MTLVPVVTVAVVGVQTLAYAAVTLANVPTTAVGSPEEAIDLMIHTLGKFADAAPDVRENESAYVPAVV